MGESYEEFAVEGRDGVDWDWGSSICIKVVKRVCSFVVEDDDCDVFEGILELGANVAGATLHERYCWFCWDG